VWLNLTNTQGAFKQTLIGYVSGATNDYESAYDGEVSMEMPLISIVCKTEKLCYQVEPCRLK
jgi:hypothetical protein